MDIKLKSNYELKVMYDALKSEILKRQKHREYNDLIRLRINLKKQLEILDRKILEFKNKLS